MSLSKLMDLPVELWLVLLTKIDRKTLVKFLVVNKKFFNMAFALVKSLRTTDEDTIVNHLIKVKQISKQEKLGSAWSSVFPTLVISIYINTSLKRIRFSSRNKQSPHEHYSLRIDSHPFLHKTTLMDRIESSVGIEVDVDRQCYNQTHFYLC